MRIAIVNDMRLAVEALRRALALRPEHRIAWVAADGAEAAARCLADRPDLVLMDLIMPVMNGVQATCRIMRDSPCPILVVTATVGGNMGLVFEAMGCGALDAVNTPVLGADGSLAGAEPFLRKIEMIACLTASARPGPLRDRPPAPGAGAPGARPALVVVGASTGGPAALETILSQLPTELDAAMVVVQHVDASFAGDLAAWLTRRSVFPVRVAAEGCRPGARAVWLAGTNDHLILARDGTLRYTPEPADAYYRPSVDVFFRSVAAQPGAPGVAVLLTGMGRDGAEGLLALRQAGWHTICQDEATAVVFGMPRAAIEAGAAAEVRPLPAIAGAVARRLQGRAGAA